MMLPQCHHIISVQRGFSIAQEEQKERRTIVIDTVMGSQQEIMGQALIGNEAGRLP